MIKNNNDSTLKSRYFSKQATTRFLRVTKLYRQFIVGFALVVTSNLVVSGCKPAVVKAPRRPISVPQDAVWSGGIDGGNWFKCDSALAESSLYWVTVFWESDGEVRATGSFSLEGNWIAPESLAQRISYYDGSRIGLIDGRVLNPRNVVEPNDSK